MNTEEETNRRNKSTDHLDDFSVTCQFECWIDNPPVGAASSNIEGSCINYYFDGTKLKTLNTISLTLGDLL